MWFQNETFINIVVQISIKLTKLLKYQIYLDFKPVKILG